MKGPSAKRPERSRGIRDHGAPATPRSPKARNTSPKGRQDWIWGAHAVTALLHNPSRTVHEFVASPAALARLGSIGEQHGPTLMEARDIDRLLPPAAVHQGLAVRAAPLEWPHLEALARDSDLLIVLDQVTDPHNVGAMFRLASAFGAGALVMQDRHAPPLTGATAKVATGCVETVPTALVTNIANTLATLKDHGYLVTGLAGDTDLTLAQALKPGPSKNSGAASKHAIVMGAEGPGLRDRVARTCDQLARIPMQASGAPGTAESLNVATAAAIALYEARRDN